VKVGDPANIPRMHSRAPIWSEVEPRLADDESEIRGLGVVRLELIGSVRRDSARLGLVELHLGR